MNWPPDFMRNLATANYGMWNSPDPGLTLGGHVQPGEGGVDIGNAIGTPVYALADGPVVASGYWNDAGHGVITQRVNVPGAGTQDLYYQHIQLDPSISRCQSGCSQYLRRGQLIGTIGPYPEIEMGFNSAWGGVWGSNHPGPWIRDPRPWLQALIGGTGAGPSVLAMTGQPTTNAPPVPGSVFFQDLGIRIGMFLAAMVVVLLGFYLLFQKQIDKTVGVGIKTGALLL